MFGLSLHILSPNSMLLCWYNLLVMRFPQVVVPQHRARQDFPYEGRLFGWCLRIALLSRIQVVPDASWKFQVCPAEAFNPNSLAFRRIEFVGAEFWDTQPWTFFFQDSNLSLSTFFSTSRWGCSSHHQLVDISNDSRECICFQTCNHDTRDDVDNHATIFFILSTVDKEFSALVVGLAFRLFKLFPSVCVFHFRYRRGCLLLDENFLRISTSFHVLLTVSPVARVCRMLHASLLEQGSIGFRWKHSSVLPLGVRIFRPFLLLLAFAQTSARKFTIQLWIPSGQGITDANPSGDDSELSYHLSTSPNTQTHRQS